MVKVTADQALSTGKLLGVDFKVISPETWQYAMNVELEHGSKFGLTNVSKNDLIITGKIALAHILEFPDYYQRLRVMEEEGDSYWEGEDRRVLRKDYNPETSRVYKLSDILIVLLFIYFIYLCFASQRLNY